MSVDKGKCDKELGLKVREVLEASGVETPMLKGDFSPNVEKMESAMAEVMNALGLDLSNESLADTPKRVAKMWAKETMWGLDYSNFPKCMDIENTMQYTGMIIERNIKVQSNCEHHWLPIVGVAHVAYVPNKKVIGLSKLNRIVEFFCRRPQVQERLTAQICLALMYILETDSVAVVIKAEHSCVRLRGVEDCGSDTITSRVEGAFASGGKLRNELFQSLLL